MNTYSTTGPSVERQESRPGMFYRLALTAIVHVFLFFVLIRSNPSFYARCVGSLWQTEVFRFGTMTHWIMSLVMWLIYLMVARLIMHYFGMSSRMIPRRGFNFFFYFKRFALFTIVVFLLNSLLGFGLSYVTSTVVSSIFMKNLFWISLFDTVFGFLLITLEEFITRLLTSSSE